MVNGFIHSSSTFVCEDCGKVTRYTGIQSVGSRLCPYCYEKAGYENAYNDGHINKEEFEKAVEHLNECYNRKESVVV